MSNRIAAAASIAALTLTACSASPANSSIGPGSMGNGAGMGGASAYHYSTTTCSAPVSLPGEVIQVVLADMGMTSMMGGTASLSAHMMIRAVPAAVRAGQVSLVVANRGWRTHELVILPLPLGASAGQRVPGTDGNVNEAGSLGEASSSCAAGTGEGIAAKTVGWTTVTLPAGRYELICNLPNHYADGMYQELNVT